MSIQNLPLRQTMLSFAYLAYTGEGITTPNPESTILSNINNALPKLNLSNWNVVWGPVAYTVPGGLYQDNLVYVVQNSTTNQYVIAVRGTNFISQVDWFLEDFEIVNTMPWPMPGASSNCAAGSAITESTSIDMNLVLGPNMVSNGDGLLAFLYSKAGGGSISIDICVTGHSLGGVLSNTLALYLLENKKLWGGSNSTVSCISFAAPTAGNDLFATNANTVFANAFTKDGSTSFPGWDTTLATNLDNVACSMDAAPLFYNGTNVFTNGAAGALFSLYSSPNNSTDNIDFANLPDLAGEEWTYFQSLVLQALAGVMTSQNYTQLTCQVLPGNFTGNSLKLPSSAVDLTSLSAFLKAFEAQGAWQHSSSYPALLNVPLLFDPTIINRSIDPPAPVPQISSISPDNVYRVHPLGVTVTITGTGFDAGNMFGNFILFSDQGNLVPYCITAATETEITVTFYVDDCSDGVQNVSVATTSPYYTSNTAAFTISALKPAT